MSDKEPKQFQAGIKRPLKVEPFKDLTDRPFAFIGGMSGEAFEAAFQADLAAIRKGEEGEEK